MKIIVSEIPNKKSECIFAKNIGHGEYVCSLTTSCICSLNTEKNKCIMLESKS